MEIRQKHQKAARSFALHFKLPLGFKQAMPIQVPKSPVPPFPEKSSRMYKQHNDI